MGFVSSTIEFHPILYRTPEYCHFKEQLSISRHNSRQNRWHHDPKVSVDYVSDLSSSEERVFFLSFHFLQTDLFLEAGIQDDFVQC